MTQAGLDPDWRLRLAAFAQLPRRSDAPGGVVTAEDLDAGFDYEGERIRLWDARRGIWRPRQLGSDGAALTVVTAPPRPGKTPPCDDQVGSETEWFVYKYEGTDPDLWTNVAVRRAYQERRPLIYLYGITPGLYEPVFPCYVVADDAAILSFHLMVESPARSLGVDPDYRVHVRRDVLEEHDGPMLQHGLQEMHDVRIRLPRAEGQRPRREYLEERFGRFRAA